MFFEIGIARWGELLRYSTMFFEIGIARWGELLRYSTMFFEFGIARWGELLRIVSTIFGRRNKRNSCRSSPQRAINWRQTGAFELWELAPASEIYDAIAAST